MSIRLQAALSAARKPRQPDAFLAFSPAFGSWLRGLLTVAAGKGLPAAETGSGAVNMPLLKAENCAICQRLSHWRSSRNLGLRRGRR